MYFNSNIYIYMTGKKTISYWGSLRGQYFLILILYFKTSWRSVSYLKMYWEWDRLFRKQNQGDNNSFGDSVLSVLSVPILL